MLKIAISRGLTGVALMALLALPAAALAGGGRRAAGRAPLQGLININNASLVELQLLSGVGPAKAQAIADYREKHPFRTVEELGRVKGIGPKTVHRLRSNLTVHGPTTARAAGGDAKPPAASPEPPPLLRRPDPASPGGGSLGGALPR
jgi:competence protein ComEA